MIFSLLFSFASLFFFHSAQASVIIHGTRVIFAAQDKEATVQLSNQGKSPTLVQSWLDKGEDNESPGNIDVPFVLSPTLFRLEPDEGQALRILYTGEPLPADKESLFWLNVLEVPPKAEDSEDSSGSLRFVFRTRIKLMYRPQGLPGSALQAGGQLQWSLATDDPSRPMLRAANPTPYVVNLGYVDLKAAGQTFKAGSGYVLPGETALFAVEEANGRSLAGGLVIYDSLNDWGGAESHEAALAP